MILAAYKNPDGKVKGGLYDTYEEYIKETFSPECKEIGIVEFKIHGRKYAECKSNAEDIALEAQYLMSELSLYQGELAWIGSWLETIGRKYGLLREFKENAIC
jgi:hypothetical protein